MSTQNTLSAAQTCYPLTAKRGKITVVYETAEAANVAAENMQRMLQQRKDASFCAENAEDSTK